MNFSLPPYPRFGECIRAYTNALDISKPGSDIGRLAREGDFDWEKLDFFFDEILQASQKICGESVAPILKKWLFDIRESYTHLILGVSLDALNRNQSLPILLANFLPPHLAELLTSLSKQIPGPDLKNLLDTNKRPIEMVLLWIDERLGQSIEKLLFSSSTEVDRTEKEKLRKWRKGIDFPSTQSISLLNASVQNRSKEAPPKNSAALWLLIATAISRIEQDSGQSLRPLLYKCIQSKNYLHDAPLALEKQVFNVGESWPELRKLGAAVWHELQHTTSKQIGDQNLIWKKIAELQSLALQQDPEGRTAYHYEWMKARWHALSGQHEEAFAFYQSAFELACYRAGRGTKQIINEAVCIAGLLEKKAFLKQLKHVGISMGGRIQT